MTLGERIYTLRTERNLSQGELADALDVSRQSVSKWENNNSVPDLEKLVKLSALFGVSLDELVKGEKPAQTAPPEAPKTEPEQRSKPTETGFPPRKIAGVILLCMVFPVFFAFLILGGLRSGLFYAYPLLLGGMACFLFRRNTGIWCGWVMGFALDFFVRYSTAVNWRYIFFGFSERLAIQIIIAWVQFLCFLLLTFFTVRRFGLMPLKPTGKIVVPLLCGWVIWIILQLLPFRNGLYTHWHTGIDWCLSIAVQALLVLTVRVFRWRRQKKESA